ncbi:MAG: hypothetical protein RLZZ399_2870 [Verrucomicrobiota bacterium]|jgi:tetratricopeptide (TPR) repeat protein
MECGFCNVEGAMRLVFFGCLFFVGAAHAVPKPSKPPKALPVSGKEEVPRAVPAVREAPQGGGKGEGADASSVEFRTEGLPLLSAPVVPKAVEVSGGGENAPSTTSPEDFQLSVADGLYERKQWDGAILEYQRFIEQFVNSPKVGTAFFRLAEAHLAKGNINSARLFYNKQLSLKNPGPFAGLAAYKLGDFEFKDKDYAQSLVHYKKSAELLQEPEIRRSAQFYHAVCLQRLGKKGDARAFFQPLADAVDDHPYREWSQFYLGELLEDAGKKAEALRYFYTLSERAQTAVLKAESSVKYALLLRSAEPSKATEAVEAMERALKISGTERHRGDLRLGILETLDSTRSYPKVIESFQAMESTLEGPQLTSALEIVGRAHVRMKLHARALELFDRLLAMAPDIASGSSIRYQRLVCLYNLNAKDVLREIDTYISSNPPSADRVNALLMKAEVMRLREDFAGAAGAYSLVADSKGVESHLWRDALLRWAQCAVCSGDAPQTIEATTRFLSHAPDHSGASVALWWRAETHRRSKNYGAAEKDYQLLVERYSGAEERPHALFQWALLRGEQKDFSSMGGFFERLLSEYPSLSDRMVDLERPANRSDAHHWIACASWEGHDYAKALKHYAVSRSLDPEKYFETDSRQSIACALLLSDPELVWTEVQGYLAKSKNRVPQDTLRWCANQFLSQKLLLKSEAVFTLLCAGEEVMERDWLELARVRLSLERFEEAAGAVEGYLSKVSHPAERVVGLLLAARASLGVGKQDAAQKAVDESLRLQPEGLLNAEAKMMDGDIKAFLKQWDAAARVYASLAIYVDDEQLLPQILERAYRAYQSAGKVKESSDALNRLQTRFPEYAREHLR